jgi:hypothetical protein
MAKKMKWIIKLILLFFSLYTLTQCANTCSAITKAAELYKVRIGENINGTVIEKQVSDTITIADATVFGQAFDYNYYIAGYTLQSIVTTFELIEKGNGYYKYKIDSEGYFNLIYDISVFSITFKYYDENGNTAVKSDVLKYNDMPKAPEIPEMPYGTFLSWDMAITKVTESKQYTAVYSYINYTVNYILDGEIVKTVLINHYDKTILSYKPKLENYYSFEGWSKETDGEAISELNINNDITLYALTSYDDRSLVERIFDWFLQLMTLVKIIVIIGIVVAVLFAILVFVGLFNNAFQKRK